MGLFCSYWVATGKAVFGIPSFWNSLLDRIEYWIMWWCLQGSQDEERDENHDSMFQKAD